MTKVTTERSNKLDKGFAYVKKGGVYLLILPLSKSPIKKCFLVLHKNNVPIIKKVLEVKHKEEDYFTLEFTAFVDD